MKRHLVAVAWAALVSFFPQLVEACQSPEDVRATIAAQFPETISHLRFSGAGAARFAERLNAVPPETAYDADEVAILANPNYPRFYLVHFFVDGCLTSGGAVRRIVVDSLRDDMASKYEQDA